MTFPGFTESDFDIFSIADFIARMGAIRIELRPKLVALGEELAPRVAELVTGAMVPHTAAHMRRRTHPPPATWVAFGRSSRGYKRFVHFRVAAHAGGLRVTVQIEDDADDKAAFAAALRRDRDLLLDRLSRQKDLVWYIVLNLAIFGFVLLFVRAARARAAPNERQDLEENALVTADWELVRRERCLPSRCPRVIGQPPRPRKDVTCEVCAATFLEIRLQRLLDGPLAPEPAAPEATDGVGRSLSTHPIPPSPHTLFFP